MIAKVYSAIPDGYHGQIIEVEGETRKSLPSFNIVGMANKTISEARERVRAAICNSNFSFPPRKVTINLAPAELTKNGSQLDLPIALNILALSSQLLPETLHDRLFVGELSLNGQLKPIRGIINIVECARSAGFSEVYLPLGNLRQARLVPNIKVIGVKNLLETVLHLQSIRQIPVSQVAFNHPSSSIVKSTTPRNSVVENTSTSSNSITSSTNSVVQNSCSTIDPGLTLDYLQDQPLAKRALIIAIAGHHNLLFSGPPGAGKTMLSRIAANLLPPPTLEEQISLTKIYSLCHTSDAIVTERPFRSPHHSASLLSLIGGGSTIAPGEITLAHHGILFLDELPEFPRATIEALRQPLEDRSITISRAHQHVTYPADFILIATMNPCPCGFYNDPTTPCTCTCTQIANYHKKISGPILDRIDLTINVKRPKQLQLPSQNVVKNTATDIKGSSSPGYSEHRKAQTDIARCYQLQQQRYHTPNLHNGSLSSAQVNQYIQLSAPAKNLLDRAAKSFQLSGRSFFKILKVARTIADLAESPHIKTAHISEALALRQQIR